VRSEGGQCCEGGLFGGVVVVDGELRAVAGGDVFGGLDVLGDEFFLAVGGGVDELLESPDVVDRGCGVGEWVAAA